MYKSKYKQAVCILFSVLLVLTPFANVQAEGFDYDENFVNSYYEQEPSAIGNGGAVATEHPLASEAAIEIMEKGGNAIDAAIAAAAVQNLTRPFSGGIGGGGMMNIYFAEDEENVTLTHRSMSPASFDIESFEDENGDIYPSDVRINGGRSVGVPGTVLAWEEALDNYGTMTLAEVLQPAITSAKEGFVIDDNFVREVTENADRFRLFESTSEIFLTENGEIPEAGSILKNPDLAYAFELIAEHGSEVFYNGEIGEAIIGAVNNPPTVDNPGAEVLAGEMTMADFAAYEVVTGEPITTTYRGYDFYGMPPVSSGGLLIGEILNILEAYDLSSMSDTEFYHHFIEASRLGFADRGAYHADPEHIDVPVNGLISKQFAADRRQHINDTAAVGKIAPGDAWKYEEDPNRDPDPLPELEANFSYDFAGDQGDAWDSDTFFVDTSYDTTFELDGEGFANLHIGDRRNSAGRATAQMEWSENQELLVPFRINDPGPNRYMRFWLRADGFNLSSSPHNGYGVEIRSGYNDIRLINRADGEGGAFAQFDHDLTDELQWLRFKVVDNQLSVKVWKDGTEEPENWNLVVEDDSVTDPGRLLISTIEFEDTNGGGSFSIGPLQVEETDERSPDLEPGFEYDFSGAEGDGWDNGKFSTETEDGAVVDLDGEGFGRVELADQDRSSARMSALMKPAENQELLVPFSMDPGNSRDLRFWLRSDNFTNLQSPSNGYGVDIRSAWNSIRLVKTVDGSLQEIGRFNHTVTDELQWLRFKVVDEQLSVKVWKGGEDEPDDWNLIAADDSVSSPGKLLISAREYRDGEGAGGFKIGSISVEETDEQTYTEQGFSHQFTGDAGDPWDESKFTLYTRNSIMDQSGDGYGRIEIPENTSYGTAVANMSAAENTEMLVPYQFTDMDEGSNPHLRFWLRADYPSPTVSPYNGYGVDIRPSEDRIRLVKAVNGDNTWYHDIAYEFTDEEQMLRFKVENNQIYVKVWNGNDEEPSEWSFVTEDDSVSTSGSLMIGAYEFGTDGAGIHIGDIQVEDLEASTVDSMQTESQENEQDETEENSDEEKKNSETINLTVADSYGNVVAYTNTIVSIGGNGMVVPGYGFLLNDVLANRTRSFAAEGEPNSAAPHMKPLSTMAPTIIMQDGEPVFAGGAPGSLTIISTVTQIILAYLDRGVELPDAVEMARLSQQNKISGRTIIEKQFTETEEYEELKALGHKFEVSDLTQGIGSFNGIGFMPDGNKQPVAEAVRRGGGSAMAYDINLEQMNNLLEHYIETAEVNDPLKSQLTTSLNQVEHHDDKGQMEQSIKKMEDFLKKINNNELENHISQDAKNALISHAETLIGQWK
ncbi:gamma-glutamyltransferase [Oceanobacillus damuensis]|uniref:gamma-glutamyltransferase n=1 Tax=Oceanobacillus damuensis TaxID=937928 RepID=UPI00082C8A2B|nr:gamma-glutamyltransferase [Oceanobacillus damuensis]